MQAFVLFSKNDVWGNLAYASVALASEDFLTVQQWGALALGAAASGTLSPEQVQQIASESRPGQRRPVCIDALHPRTQSLRLTLRDCESVYLGLYPTARGELQFSNGKCLGFTSGFSLEMQVRVCMMRSSVRRRVRLLSGCLCAAAVPI